MLIPSSLGVPVLYCFWQFSLLLAVFSGGLDVPGVLGCKLEESGNPWACLNGSRSLGLRQVLAWPTL